MNLNQFLDRTADRVASNGTEKEMPVLAAMADAVRDLNPGAAAALVDWGGPEVARLRAFGIVHGILLRELPSAVQAQLLAELLNPSHAMVLAA